MSSIAPPTAPVIVRGRSRFTWSATSADIVQVASDEREAFALDHRGSPGDRSQPREILRLVLAKFTQHPELRELLLATGDAALVEHTENDAYWGDGGDGSGKNRLGEIPMRVREELRHRKPVS